MARLARRLGRATNSRSLHSPPWEGRHSFQPHRLRCFQLRRWRWAFRRRRRPRRRLAIAFNNPAIHRKPGRRIYRIALQRHLGRFLLAIRKARRDPGGVCPYLIRGTSGERAPSTVYGRSSSEVLARARAHVAVTMRINATQGTRRRGKGVGIAGRTWLILIFWMVA